MRNREAPIYMWAGAPFPACTLPSLHKLRPFPIQTFNIVNCTYQSAKMANTTLGKRTRSSKQEGTTSLSYTRLRNKRKLELTLDADSEPTLSLDFSAKRPRRTPRKTSEKEHISVHDKENQENEQQHESDSEATPTKSYSRRTSIASTVRSCKPSLKNKLTCALQTNILQPMLLPLLLRPRAITMSSPGPQPLRVTASCLSAGSRSA